MLGNNNPQIYNRTKGLDPTSRFLLQWKKEQEPWRNVTKCPRSYLKPDETGNDDTERAFQ